MIAWIDLETTGLDPERSFILEVACVVTDDDLRELGRFHRVVNKAAEIPLGNLDPVVLEMHFANGLWMESVALAYAGTIEGHRSRIEDVDRALLAFLRGTIGYVTAGPDWKLATETQLGGSTISFDRAFMARHMPKSLDVLHYRNVDVTTLNEFARRYLFELHEKRPRSGGKKHRALDDVLESIAVFAYYRERLCAVAAHLTREQIGTPEIIRRIDAIRDVEPLLPDNDQAVEAHLRHVAAMSDPDR